MHCQSLIEFLIVAGAATIVSCSSIDDTPSPPLVDFSIGCTAIVDSLLTFTNESEHVETYSWDFGNGTTSNDKHPTIAYRQEGEYVVRLIGTSRTGESDTAIRQVRVVTLPGDWKELSVEMMELQRWIWPWATAMVLRHFGVRISECQIMDHYYGRDCCINPEACPSFVTDQQLVQSLSHHGRLEGQWQYAPLSLEQIRMEIAQDRPAIAILEKGGYRYVVLIVGWYEWGAVQIIDPYNGVYSLAYGDLVRFGEYDWRQSLYCIGKK